MIRFGRYTTITLSLVVEELPVETQIELLDIVKEMVPYMHYIRSEVVVFRYGDKKEIVPLDAVGDGLKSLIELAIPIAMHSDIVLVEEPEMHMHPGYMEAFCRTFVEMLKRYPIQYFMSAHSLEFLRYLLMYASQQKLLDRISI